MMNYEQRIKLSMSVSSLYLGFGSRQFQYSEQGDSLLKTLAMAFGFLSQILV